MIGTPGISILGLIVFMEVPKVIRKKAIKRRELLQRAMIKALEKNLGIVSAAARAVGIDRSVHYEWLKEDEGYKQAVDNITELALDFAESKLHEKIKNNDTIGIIFYLKTKGKRRGYIEKLEQEITGPGGGSIILKLDDGCEPIKKDGPGHSGI